MYDTTQADHNTVIFNGLVTGQCGEQPLPDHGCCCLGSLNLARFVLNPFSEAAHIDWPRLRRTVHTAVRMLGQRQMKLAPFREYVRVVRGLLRGEERRIAPGGRRAG